MQHTNIIVCMKIVIDPEMPFSEFMVDRENRRPVPPSGVPPLFSPFDENALEAALGIKNGGECRITVLSVGKALPKAVLQKVLAAGADEAIAVEDPEFECLDPFATAQVIAAAVRKTGGADLIFTGRQGADWDAGVTWACIAEELDLPCITLARRVEVTEGTVMVERCAADSIEVVEAPLPALVTFTSEAGELRGITLPALIAAKKRAIMKWSAIDVGFESGEAMAVNDLYIPEMEGASGLLIAGENPREKGRNLARWLLDNNIVAPRG